jgi:hypothetical protein
MFPFFFRQLAFGISYVRICVIAKTTCLRFFFTSFNTFDTSAFRDLYSHDRLGPAFRFLTYPVCFSRPADGGGRRSIELHIALINPRRGPAG